MDETAFSPVTEEKKKGFPWKKVGIIAGVIAALAVVFLLLSLLIFRSDRTTPLKTMEKYANAKEVKIEAMYKDYIAGSDGGNAVKILKLLRESDEFEDWFEDTDEAREDLYDVRVDEYGKDFKIRYEIDKSSEEKLDRDELKEQKAEIKELGEMYADLGKTLGRIKGDDLEDLADNLDLDVKELKELTACLKELGSKLKSAEVTEGYTYEYTATITGSELDDPEEDDRELTVLKVNGKWVGPAQLGLLRTLYYAIFNEVGRYL